MSTNSIYSRKPLLFKKDVKKTEPGCCKICGQGPEGHCPGMGLGRHESCPDPLSRLFEVEGIPHGSPRLRGLIQARMAQKSGGRRGDLFSNSDIRSGLAAAKASGNTNIPGVGS